MLTEGTLLTEDDFKWLTDFKPFTGEAPPKNFFDIGLRGHFENPMSDILSFYLDPEQDATHGFGDLLLSCLLKKLTETTLNGQSDVKIEREWELDDGKRIDIVVSGDKWVLAIEHKVVSGSYNDFGAYKKAIEECPDFKDKATKLFCLLTPRKSEPATEGWKHVDSVEFTANIQSSLDDAPTNYANDDALTINKWRVFFDEFAENLRQVSGRGESRIMEDQDIETYTKELRRFYRISESYNAYYDEIRKKLEGFLEAKYQATYPGLKVASSAAHGCAPQTKGFRFRPFEGEEHEVQFFICADEVKREKTTELFQIRYFLKPPTDLKPPTELLLMERKRLAKLKGFESFRPGSDKYYECVYANASTFEKATQKFLDAIEAICNYREKLARSETPAI